MPPPKPDYPAPRGRPVEWNKDELLKHCQTAVLLELHTIPLYLFAFYCIDPNDTTDAFEKILEVVIQEMLHLCLAGNLSCAVGGQPVLYGQEHTPKYPCQIFYEPMDLYLRPPNEDAIKMFVKVEEPFQRITFPRGNIMPQYSTIGEFYESLIDGLRILNDKWPGQLFDPSTATRQFNPNDGVYYDSGLHTITDLGSAFKALHLIIEQGEGSTGQDEVVPSHWNIFKKLLAENILHYRTVADPQNTDFEGSIQTAILACDAAYSYLVLTIEKTWTPSKHRPEIVRNIMPLMKFVMKPMAEFLVTQKLDGREEHAAPRFKYFPFSSVESAHSELVAAIEVASRNYADNAKLAYALRNAKTLFDLSQLNA